MKRLAKNKSGGHWKARAAQYNVDDLCSDYEEYEERMREAFKAMLAFDEDRNGTLDMAEFTAFVTECGMLKGAEEEGHAILREIFEEADANNDEELTFQEFAVIYNQLLEFRKDMNLPYVDLLQGVTEHLRRKAEALAGGGGDVGDSSPGFSRSRTQSASEAPPSPAIAARRAAHAKSCQPPTTKESRRAEQKDDNRVKALTMMGEQNVAIMIVEVFDSMETTDGKVPSWEFVSKLREQGFGNAGMNAPNTSCDVDVMQVLGFGLPGVSKPKLLTLLENARRYIKKEKERKEKLGTKCQLYLDIKKNRKEVTQEIKQEALSLFAAVDTDHDKELDVNEFCSAVNCLLDEEMAEELFHLVDADNSGKISPFEFVAFWTLGVEFAAERAEDYDLHLLGLIDATHKDNDLDVLLRTGMGEDMLLKGTTVGGA